MKRSFKLQPLWPIEKQGGGGLGHVPRGNINPAEISRHILKLRSYFSHDFEIEVVTKLKKLVQSRQFEAKVCLNIDSVDNLLPDVAMGIRSYDPLKLTRYQSRGLADVRPLHLSPLLFSPQHLGGSLQIAFHEHNVINTSYLNLRMPHTLSIDISIQ